MRIIEPRGLGPRARYHAEKATGVPLRKGLGYRHVAVWRRPSQEPSLLAEALLSHGPSMKTLIDTDRRPRCHAGGSGSRPAGGAAIRRLHGRLRGSSVGRHLRDGRAGQQPGDLGRLRGRHRESGARAIRIVHAEPRRAASRPRARGLFLRLAARRGGGRCLHRQLRPQFRSHRARAAGTRAAKSPDAAAGDCAVRQRPAGSGRAEIRAADARAQRAGRLEPQHAAGAHQYLRTAAAAACRASDGADGRRRHRAGAFGGGGCAPPAPERDQSNRVDGQARAAHARRDHSRPRGSRSAATCWSRPPTRRAVCAR